MGAQFLLTVQELVYENKVVPDGVLIELAAEIGFEKPHRLKNRVHGELRL